MQSWDQKNAETINPDSFHPATPEDFLPPVGRWATWGGLTLLLLLGVMVFSASRFKYKITVKAPAQIRPVGELRIIQAATEGTVKSIEVQTNQVVEKGDIIASVDDSRLQTQRRQRQGDITEAIAKLQQLQGQIQALETQITSETQKLQRNLAGAEAQLAQSQREYQDRQKISVAEVTEAQANLELATEELRRYQQLANTGAIAQLQIKEREATLKTAQARLTRAKTALNPSAAAVEIAQERIAQIQATGEATLARLNQEQEQLLQAQAELQNQRNNSQSELQQIETELQDTVIIASTAGIIAQLNLRNGFQRVRPGDIIAQISPRNSALEIKATVTATDISKIAKGQRVQMRVSACPYPDYGVLEGVVSEIAPDTLKSDENTPLFSGEASYDITIVPKTLNLQLRAQECIIQAGMEGRADIISREETLLQFILRKARLITEL